MYQLSRQADNLPTFQADAQFINFQADRQFTNFLARQTIYHISKKV